VLTAGFITKTNLKKNKMVEKYGKNLEKTGLLHNKLNASYFLDGL
jgi:hypothetical protein